MSNAPADWRDQYGGSVVYFIRIGKAIKIGTTTDIKRRLKDLHGGTAESIHVMATFPGDRKGERFLHEMFSNLRIRNEFFRYEHPLSAFLNFAEDYSLKFALDWISDLHAEQVRLASMSYEERKLEQMARKAQQRRISEENYQRIVAERIRQRDGG